MEAGVASADVPVDVPATGCSLPCVAEVHGTGITVQHTLGTCRGGGVSCAEPTLTNGNYSNYHMTELRYDGHMAPRPEAEQVHGTDETMIRPEGRVVSCGDGDIDVTILEPKALCEHNIGGASTLWVTFGGMWTTWIVSGDGFWASPV